MKWQSLYWDNRAITKAIITGILIFQRTNQPSIALTEEWITTQVPDRDSIVVR
ncbi:hypothetical protein [Nostoc flagelliforme]|uniref:hypothetical protein n=1 Tax=Nostoc flagelliforme TaxID=1306274 RepID=UPI001688D67D|nr:hypothetical protein [Nostoc flagelliforme]